MGLKSILKKILIYGFLGLILLIAGLFVFSGRDSEDFPEYSTLNAEKNGVKALYLLTEKMGYVTKRYKWPAKFLPDHATMIAVKPDPGILNIEQERTNLKEWLKKGNTLILIDDSSKVNEYKLDEFINTQTLKVGSSENSSEYSIGAGKIVLLEDSRKFTNKGLKSIAPGVLFIKTLDNIGNKRVVFNEYYHGFEENPSLWDLLGQTGRLIIIQIALCLIILMYIKSRRLGKPVTVLEIVKRKENENMFALSNIYLKSKANYLVLETCFNSFKQELSRFLGFSQVPDDSTLVTAAMSNRRLREINIAEVFNSCNDYINDEKKNLKQMVNLVKKLEEIREEIR